MKSLRQWLAPILTAIMWVGIILILAVTVSIVFETSEFFWTITTIGAIIVVVTNIVWSPTGIEIAEKTAKVHNNNVIYKNRANYIVNNQLFKKLREFCDWRNKKHKKEIITSKLADRQLEYNDYDNYCAFRKNWLKTRDFATQNKEIEQNTEEKNEEQQKFEEYCKQFTYKQLKLMSKLYDKEPKFEKLQPDHLTKGHNTHGKLVPHNKEKTYRTVLLAGKVVWGILLGIFTACIVVNSKGFGMQETIQVIVWTFTIITNIYTSINSAYKSVYIYRNNYFIEKNDRCAEFFEYIELNVKDIDKEVANNLIIGKFDAKNKVLKSIVKEED